jgi:hypothetical protein
MVPRAVISAALAIVPSRDFMVEEPVRVSKGEAELNYVIMKIP